MKKQILHNKGFSLIELLIAMTIFSIISVVLVTFMSSTTAAYKKTQQNVQVQTEAMQIQQQITDILMQADYVRVALGNDIDFYSLTADSTKKGSDARKFESIVGKDPASLYSKPAGMTDDEYAMYLDRVKYAMKLFSDAKSNGVAMNFIPDNYANYVKPATETDERKVIIDYENFRLVDEYGKGYPLTNDRDNTYATEAANPLRSFQILRPAPGFEYCYIKPKYIYVEYLGKDATNKDERMHAMYCIDKNNIYLYKYNDTESTSGFDYAKGKVDALVTAKGTKGRLTDLVDDFYMSADASGNCFVTNIMFKNKSYIYNSTNAVNFRNSNVLTVRPQNMYKKVIHGVLPPDPTVVP